MSRRTSFRKLIRLVAMATTVLVAFGACGGSDRTTTAGSDEPARTIDIEMQDNSFTPSAVTVKKGEQVRFVFTNTGKVPHDAFVGNEVEQENHAAEMNDESADNAMSGMDHGGAVNAAVTVRPGKSDEIEISFAEKGEQIIGCHEAGHYAEGMRILVTVE